MEKIALVRRKNSSSWVSCQSITENLARAYRTGFPQAEISEFFFESTDTRFDVVVEARRLLEFSPSRIAFIDHMPHPGVFLRALKLAEPVKLLPELIFHVFGDFTLHVNAWLAMTDFLTKHRFRFICASEKQTELLRGFTEASEGLVHWIPFPVAAPAWKFAPEIISSAREALGISSTDFVFLYSGRVSLQKNVQGLVSSFARFLKVVDSRAWLLLAGRTDDLGAPYLGKKPAPGWLAERLAEQIRDEIPENLQNRVRYLGELDASALRPIYHAADYYVSLSTHNDEDFGMAPAEAAFCGLPSILTDWAGFSSFRKIDEETFRYVPVRFGQESVLPDYAEVLRAMIQVSETRVSLEKRKRISESAEKFCAIETVGTELRKYFERVEPPSFQAFSSRFQAMGRAFRARPNAPFLSGTGYSKLYEEVYAPYF